MYLSCSLVFLMLLLNQKVIFFFFLEHIIANNAQNPFPLKPQFGAIFVFGSLEGPTLRAEIVHVSSFV